MQYAARYPTRATIRDHPPIDSKSAGLMRAMFQISDKAYLIKAYCKVAELATNAIGLPSVIVTDSAIPLQIVGAVRWAQTGTDT